MRVGTLLPVVLALILGVHTFAGVSQAQQGGQTPPSQPPSGGGSGGTSPSSTTTTSTPRGTTTQPSQRQLPQMQQPIYIQGTVMMDDGSSAPGSVLIERVCGTVVTQEAHTDSKGRFSFEIGRSMNVMPDASVGASNVGSFGQGSPGTSGGFSNSPFSTNRVDLTGCELRANLSGYRSDTVNLDGRRAFDNPRVGPIVLHRIAGIEGTTISITNFAAPRDAQKALKNGEKELDKKKWPKAQKELEKAVKIYPQYAAAWEALGRSHELQGNMGEARKAYERAIECDEKFIGPHFRLAFLSANENKWQEVADRTDRVLKLNPFDFPVAYFYNSVANFNLQNLDKAEESAREARKLDTRHVMPRIEHLLGTIMDNKRDYRAAAEHLEAYLELDPEASNADAVKQRIGELQGLAEQQGK